MDGLEWCFHWSTAAEPLSWDLHPSPGWDHLSVLSSCLSLEGMPLDRRLLLASLRIRHWRDLLVQPLKPYNTQVKHPRTPVQQWLSKVWGNVKRVWNLRSLAVGTHLWILIAHTHMKGCCTKEHWALNTGKLQLRPLLVGGVLYSIVLFNA